ncbi:MAG: xanthine dehydrogenase family protein subunit M, partial [Acidobacteria bacterium]|nr:xanthine dehydrogenase family protein subunit M [Acidobacteriota bacterium]
MIPQSFEYSVPNTLQEALQLLAGGNAKVLAGGMSLVPLMKLRLAAPEHLVDLRRITGLKTLSESSGEIR